MRRLSLLFIGLVLIASIAFIGCDNGDTSPPPEEVLEWLDTVPDNFWKVTKVTGEFTAESRTAGPETIFDPYVVFDSGNSISIWFDEDSDNVLIPEEQLERIEEAWYYYDNKIYLAYYEDVYALEIVELESDSWAMRLDISDTDLKDELLSYGYNVDGSVTISFSFVDPQPHVLED